MALLRISYVAYQPHVVITHPEIPGSSLVLRIPEFVKVPDGPDAPCPGNIVWEGKGISFPGKVVWEEVAREAHLRYRWNEDEAVKSYFATDFSGEVRAGEDEVTFKVMMRNTGDRPQNCGVYLFCLQAGEFWRLFHDYEGERTFKRLGERWTSAREIQEGKLSGAPAGKDGVVCNLAARTGKDSRWVLGMALNQPGKVSYNLQPWPSCIHANPSWRLLAPGESETAHGKVYFFKGDLEALYEKYRRDFR